MNDSDITYLPSSGDQQTFYDIDYTHWLPSADTLQVKIDDTYQRYCCDNPYTPTTAQFGSWVKHDNTTQ